MNLQWHETTINNLSRIASPEQLRDLLTVQFGALGVPYWCIGIQTAWSLNNPESYMFSNYPPHWLSEYMERNMAVIDPIVSYCVVCDQPRLYTNTGWADVAGHTWTQEGLMVSEFFRWIEGLGLKSGLVIPMHMADQARGCIIFPHPEPLDRARLILARARVWVSAIVPELYSAIRITYKIVKGERHLNLTQREREIMIWVADGLTSQEIADRLLLSRRTVEAHIASVQEKLQAENRQQALSKVINLGLVAPTVSQEGFTYGLTAIKPFIKTSNSNDD